MISDVCNLPILVDHGGCATGPIELQEVLFLVGGRATADNFLWLGLGDLTDLGGRLGVLHGFAMFIIPVKDELFGHPTIWEKHNIFL